MIRYSVYLRQDQLNSLDTIPGSISEHIREAIDMYIEDKKGKIEASFSPSQKGENGANNVPSVSQE